MNAIRQCLFVIVFRQAFEMPRCLATVEQRCYTLPARDERSRGIGRGARLSDEWEL